MNDACIDLQNSVDFSQTIANELFKTVKYPWEVLPLIGDFILNKSQFLDKSEYNEIDAQVWVAKNVSIAPSVSIVGPVIIQAGVELRHNAFIRGDVIIGKNSIIGNSCELKNSILFNNVQVPHFNYVGDSILGYKSHLGAGAILSNVRSDKKNININLDGTKFETNLRKFGAIIGDFSEIGCNAVLNPGTILKRNVTVYPTSMVRGVIPENTIFKNDGTLIKKLNNL